MPPNIECDLIQLSPETLGADKKYKVAIACQGGGSHTAYVAGFLKGLLDVGNPGRPENRLFWDRCELVALSGTSGGAVCAALAWSGLTYPETNKTPFETAIKNLEGFWGDLYSRPWDVTANLFTLPLLNIPGVMELPVPPVQQYTRDRMIELLSEHITFGTDPHGDIALLVGASNIVSGDRKVFSTTEEPPEDLTKAKIADWVRASAAVPPAFEPVEIKEQHYWDGLFTSNPPVKETLGLRNECKPDILIVVRVNPRARKAVPVLMSEKVDRRNEMSANLSLQQELDYIDNKNQFVLHFGNRNLPLFARRLTVPNYTDCDGKPVSEKQYKYVAVYETDSVPEEFTFESKYSIQEHHIDKLWSLGEEQAAKVAEGVCKKIACGQRRLQAVRSPADPAPVPAPRQPEHAG